MIFIVAIIILWKYDTFEVQSNFSSAGVTKSGAMCINKFSINGFMVKIAKKLTTIVVIVEHYMVIRGN